MADLRNNSLLWASIVVGAAYWVLAPLAENPLLSIMMSIAVMITATVAMLEYAGEAWRVVVKKKRSDDARGRGSHLAIYGFFLFSFGSVFAGAYALVWLWYGQPMGWVGSPPANFGRFCHAIGFLLMQAGPAMKSQGFVLRPRWWIAVVGATILVLLGFYLGLQFRSIEVSDVQRWKAAVIVTGRPICSPDEPVWGSARKVFHTEDSPYRPLIVPRRCFRDEEAARQSGYRAVGE